MGTQTRSKERKRGTQSRPGGVAVPIGEDADMHDDWLFLVCKTNPLACTYFERQLKPSSRRAEAPSLDLWR